MKILKRCPILFSPLLFSLLIMYGIISFSCEDEEKKKISSDIVFPDSLIIFSQHVEPLFRQTCVFPGCHSGSQPAGNLNLEIGMWSSLIDHQPSIIFVNNGYESPLVQYLDGRLQPQMPMDQPLKQNQITGVTKWIDEGAQFN